MYRRAWLASILAPIILIGAPCPTLGDDLTPAEWRSDLAFMVEKIREVHPNPFGRVPETEFRAAVAELHQQLPSLGTIQTIARMMELVVLIQDGHTKLEPSGENGFTTWFPVRFHEFSDGLFITVADKEHEELLGARVVAIGGLPVDQALQRAGSLVAADNSFWQQANGPFFLSSGEALTGLDILSTPASLPLTVLRPGSTEPLTVTLAGAQAPLSTGWFWRVLGAPPGTDAVQPFGDELPLHLRHQLPLADVYWFEYLPEERTLYFQLNGWWDWGDESFESFNNRLWTFYDANPVDRVVFDLRYNAGGDGSMFKPLLHEMIRRRELEEPGRLAVLVGRRSFSASVNSLGSLLEHTNVTIIGEPAGSGLNMYGDTRSFNLPESGLKLYVSAMYWQNGFPTDKRTVVSPHLPVVFSSADFFGGRDPAMDLALADESLKLLDLFRVRDGKTAITSYRQARVAHGDLSWWVPFTERELNRLGYELLAEDRVQDAQTAFRLNSETFPNSSNVWDSLGESYLKSRNLPEAASAYREAIRVDPGNAHARQVIQRIEEALAARAAQDESDAKDELAAKDDASN